MPAHWHRRLGPKLLRSTTRPAEGSRNIVLCRWPGERWTAPSSGSSDRSACAAKEDVRSWRSSAALKLVGPRLRPIVDRYRAILIYEVETPSATTKITICEWGFIPKGEACNCRR